MYWIAQGCGNGKEAKTAYTSQGRKANSQIPKANSQAHRAITSDGVATTAYAAYANKES
jgi:hypothetical protein